MDEPSASADQSRHAFAHFGGGLVGERDRQDLPGTDIAGGEQVGDSAGEHRRLARPGTGDDEQRRPLVEHRLALRRVQALEQFVDVRVGFLIGEMRGHVCPNLPPSCDISLRWRRPGWHTQSVLYAQRFFYGYRSAVPVV